MTSKSSPCNLFVMLLLTGLAAGHARAACINKFVVQTQANKQVVTLLTGQMTFPEATELARAIKAREIGAIEWLDAKDRVIAPAVRFTVVRPMPVACGSKASGVVVSVEFVTFAKPSKSMILKLPDGSKVTFEEQAK